METHVDLPYFEWHARDHMTCPMVMEMSATAEGIYRRLLDFQWQKGYLEDNERRLVACARASEAEWASFAPFLDEAFPVGDDGRRRNARLDQQRIRAVEKVLRNRENARGGKAPADRPPTQSKATNQRPQSDGTATKQRPQSDGEATAERPLGDRQANKEGELELDSSSSANAEVGSPDLALVEGGAPPEEPWWEVDDDALARDLVLTVRASKGYAGFDPPRGGVLAMLGKVREYAPDDEAIRHVLHGFQERAERRKVKAPEYSDPLLALLRWCGRQEANWRDIRRARERDARPKGVQRAKTDQEAVEKALGL